MHGSLRLVSLSAILGTVMRRGARVDDSACLESTCAGNGTVGSNPTLSAMSQRLMELRVELEYTRTES